MEKKKDELLNFAFNEQDEKIKFYRETLVEITKEAYRKKPKELKIEESVVEADILTKAIMNQIDEYENSFNYQTQVNENLTITANYPNFFKGVNPDFLKTEPMGTIVDHGPQYQTNQKPYGTLGEHWKELMDLFDVKAKKGKDWKRYFDKCIDYIFFDTDQFKFVDKKIKSVANILGIEFIIDFVKACEKCED